MMSADGPADLREPKTSGPTAWRRLHAYLRAVGVRSLSLRCGPDGVVLVARDRAGTFSVAVRVAGGRGPPPS
jgi:hypothetical protein